MGSSLDDDVAESEFPEIPSGVPVVHRLSRAAGRRVIRLWSKLAGRPQRFSVETAYDWLSSILGDGLPAGPSGEPFCPASTGAAITTFVELGDQEVAGRWSRSLISRQRSNGAFPNSNGSPSRFHTGQALRGLLAYQRAVSSEAALRLSRSIEDAAGYLAAQVDRQGEMDQRDASPGSIDRWGPPTIHLSWLPPLLEASRRLGEANWEAAVWRCLKRFELSVDLTRWSAPTHWWAFGVEALVDLGRVELARRALRLPAARQQRDGSVPALPTERWISSAGLAHLAVVWYKLGSPEERQRADRALAALGRRQSPRGGFFGSWGPAARYFPRQELPSAAARYIDAALWQVRGVFDGGRYEFPAEIFAKDGRWQAVFDFCKDLGPRPNIVDVGCGKGRFLRRLRDCLPNAKLTGVDVASNALSRLPGGVAGRQGSLLRIPASDGEFDAAICVEALEHALLPRQATAELCRIVRPGGSVLIIDKNRDRQALSDHKPWERWFADNEVSDWLAADCEEVSVRTIAHGLHHDPTGLFFCWTAKRRPSNAIEKAA